MRPEEGAVISRGPVTRSRDQRHQAFVMDAAAAEQALGDSQVARVLVSDPLQRNLEAARK